MAIQAKFRDSVVGTECRVQTADGSWVTAVNFDNAATTPPLHGVMERIFHFSEVYSSVHRGWGYKSMLSSDVYESGRSQLMRFVGADTKKNMLIYTKHTTEAINLLAHIIRQKASKQDVVLVSEMEHLANCLPWRMTMRVDLIPVDMAGRIQLAVLEEKLRLYGGRVKLVCISGASNVTGYINPIAKIARIVHRYGAMIVVDAAQLLPHRKINMQGRRTEEGIDFIAFSAHKMYAPFGCGALIGRSDILQDARPLMVGGGIARLATYQEIDWVKPPHLEEAGTPNVIGIAAWVEAIRILSELGWTALERRELELLHILVRELKRIDGVRIYGGDDDGVSLVSFACEKMEHRLVSCILSEEGGIAVRSGLFCAHPYVLKLLGIEKREIAAYLADRQMPLPGLVRASLSFYNTEDEVERLVTLVKKIMKHKTMYRRKYADRLAHDRQLEARRAIGRWLLS